MLNKKIVCVLITTLMLPIFPAFAQEEDRTAGASPQSEYQSTYRQLDLFGEVFERTRSEYVEEVEDKELIKNALNGMLTSLDPHSAFLDEDDFAQPEGITFSPEGRLFISNEASGGTPNVHEVEIE